MCSGGTYTSSAVCQTKKGGDECVTSASSEVTRRSSGVASSPNRIRCATGQRRGVAVIGPSSVRPASVAWAPVGTIDDQGEWLADYLGRVAGLVGDAGRVNARLASEWGARSLDGDDWTVDTLTADMIEAWDHLTPLAERGLELWLELVQQAIRSGTRP